MKSRLSCAAWVFLDVVVIAALNASAQGTSRPGPRVDQVVIAFKTHFDIGYTDMAVNVVRRYRTTMIDQALGVVDQNRDLPPQQQFAWTIPGWPMKKILDDWEGQTAERRGRVLDAFKSGRFVVHALPFTTHTELLEAEDLVHGLGFASALSRSAGLPLPRDAKMTDVACHSWFVPTLLRNAGVDFLHLGCNAGCRSPEVPRLFWWEGPDGSRLLTMYTAESYGTGLVPPADWPCKTWLALIHTGDNHGPPTPEEVKKLLDEAGQKLPGVKVRIGRLSDFADAVLAERPDLPVVRADMPDTWIHGPMCDPEGARTARNIRPLISATESLNCLLQLWGAEVDSAAEPVAAAYEQSLLYGEHTWGGALYWVTNYEAKDNFHYGDAWKRERSEGKFKRLEASWAEHSGYIKAAHDLIEPVLRANMRALAGAVDVEGARIVVYNPLPWKRDGLVDVPIGDGAGDLDAVQSVDGSEAPVPARCDAAAQFIARNVPPMGYRTYRLVAGHEKAEKPTSLSADEKTATMESPFFKAVLDASRGTVRSLIDKRTGRELVDGSAPHGFGQYLYERFDADQVQAFLNLFNNQWTTNFRMWNEGRSWGSRVRLWPVDGDDAESSLATPSAEARLPLQAAFAQGPAGRLPPSASGVSLSRRGAVVTALGRNPDGPGILLRFWEQAGRSGDCQVQLPPAMAGRRAQPVDLRGQPAGAAIPVVGGRFSVGLRGFAPGSFVIE